MEKDQLLVKLYEYQKITDPFVKAGPLNHEFSQRAIAYIFGVCPSLATLVELNESNGDSDENQEIMEVNGAEVEIGRELLGGETLSQPYINAHALIFPHQKIYMDYRNVYGKKIMSRAYETFQEIETFCGAKCDDPTKLFTKKFALNKRLKDRFSQFYDLMGLPPHDAVCRLRNHVLTSYMYQEVGAYDFESGLFTMSEDFSTMPNAGPDKDVIEFENIMTLASHGELTDLDYPNIDMNRVVIALAYISYTVPDDWVLYDQMFTPDIFHQIFPSKYASAKSYIVVIASDRIGILYEFFFEKKIKKLWLMLILLFLFLKNKKIVAHVGQHRYKHKIFTFESPIDLVSVFFAIKSRRRTTDPHPLDIYV